MGKESGCLPILLLGKWGPRTRGSVETLDRTQSGVPVASQEEKNALSGPDSGVHPWLSRQRPAF